MQLQPQRLFSEVETAAEEFKSNQWKNSWASGDGKQVKMKIYKTVELPEHYKQADINRSALLENCQSCVHVTSETQFSREPKQPTCKTAAGRDDSS